MPDGSAEEAPYELTELGAYVLGRLSPERTQEVARHVAQCLLCQLEVPLLREAVGLLGAVPPEALLEGPPEDAELLARQVVRRLRIEGTVGGQGAHRSPVPRQHRPVVPRRRHPGRRPQAPP